MAEFLDQDIKFLPGVGPKRAELLFKELQIRTFRDLIYYFPYKYIDRTKVYSIAEINAQMPYIQIKGKITSFEIAGTGPKERLTAKFADASGVIELVWFKTVKWQKENLKINCDYIVFGKPSVFGGRVSIVHPEIELADEQRLNSTGLFQGYSITSGNVKQTYFN